MGFIIQYIFNVKMAQVQWNFGTPMASIVFEILNYMLFLLCSKLKLPLYDCHSVIIHGSETVKYNEHYFLMTPLM